MLWDRLARIVAARRSWAVAAAVAVMAGLMLASAGTNEAGTESPVALPPSAESARADAVAKQFPGADQAPVIVVVTRTDGAPLTPADLDAINQIPATMGPARTSADGEAAIATVPIDAEMSGFALSDAVDELRAQTRSILPDSLRAQVTGGPAFGADIANSFTNANITLLIVTSLVVALLLIITYRSPVLWLIPLAVIGFADRAATSVATLVAEATGLNFDGSTAGITSVLVFGAGTNYALLLISRYREELRRSPDHRDALQHAVRAAGPAILASNATVVLALFTLILATVPSNRSLGVLAACGLVVAAVFVLLVLPPLLALLGRRLFWPFIPQPGDPSLVESGPWHRVAEAVARRPAAVGGVTIVALSLLATGLLGTHIGLSQTEQFRVQADSVAGFETLAEHFPGGAADPTNVIGDTVQAPELEDALDNAPGVVSVNQAGRSASGLTRWAVVLDAAPASDSAFESITALRDSVHAIDADALVGGSDAKALGHPGCGRP